MAPSKSKPTEEASESLQCQTWVLKVSIHCEGCKRKVKKILQNIEGVYTTTIDSQQHKVTVTGNVDAETLIKKLVRTGKHAELWPEEKAEKKEIKIKQTKGKGKETQNDTKSSEESNSGEDHKKETEHLELKKTPNNPKNKEASPTPPNENSVKDNGNDTIKESKADEKSPEKPPTDGQKQSAPPEKKENESNGAAVEKTAGSGKGGKKKGKKGQQQGGGDKGTEGGEAPNGAPASTIAPTPAGGHPFSFSPPRHHHAYQYPSYGHPPPPVYAVSYNTAYPSNSTSYYAPAPPSEPYGYMHPHGPPSDPNQMHYQGAYPPQSDSFEIFSEENANGCSIM